MKKTILTFGIISGVVLSAMMLVTVPFADDMGFDTATIVGYTTMIAAGMLIYFGIRSYRDNVAGGVVRFGRALAVGLLIVTVSSVLYTATWQVVSSRYYTDFMEKYQADQLASARSSGATQAELEVMMADHEKYARWYRNPVLKAAFTFVEPLPVGLIISLLSAWALSRRRGAPATVT